MLKKLVLPLRTGLFSIKGVFGDEQKEIRITMAKGGSSWNVFVDNYRQGSITFYRDRYVVHMNDRSSLSGMTWLS